MSTVGIIPARYQSVRLPGKPLLKTTGKFLIQHVWESALEAQSLDQLIIATDHPDILRAAELFGAEVCMTSKHHQTGTDRIAEAVSKLRCDIVVNIQGDEAEIEPGAIDAAVQALKGAPDAMMSTLAHPTTDRAVAANPNVVKVVCGCRGQALYFSREPIPHPRDANPDAVWLLHIGLYAYRRDFLLSYARMPQTPLEKLEKLEQLRALENGYGIQVVQTGYEARGIDTPADYQAFVERYSRGPFQGDKR
jgi:3-deoxy-manno-octulosonate cytidylyltransferase (CMP-KDO synthetase)